MSALLLQTLRHRAQQSVTTALPPIIASLNGQQGPGIWQATPTPCLPSCHHSHRLLTSVNMQQVEQLRKALSVPPTSLVFQRPDLLPSDVSDSMLGKLMLNMTMYWTDKNQAIIGGQVLYDAIKEQVDDGALCRAFGMDPKVFYSTYTLLAIHVWLIIHRLAECNGKHERFFKQRFYNHFQADVERRIYDAGVQIGVSKWLKKLETVFYSSALSFDRVLRNEDLADGTSNGSTTGSSSSNGNGKNGRDVASRLEKVVLREFFGGDFTKALQAELITRYMMYELNCLKATEDAAILKGNIQFSRTPFAPYRRHQPATSTAGVTGGVTGTPTPAGFAGQAQ